MIEFLASLGLAQRLKSALPYIGCGLAVALLCGALWWRGNHYRSQRDHEHAQYVAYLARQAAATVREQAKADASATVYEGDRHVATIAKETRETQIRTIYKDRVVSADCAIPAASRGVLADAIASANARAAGQSGEPVRPVAGTP